MSKKENPWIDASKKPLFQLSEARDRIIINNNEERQRTEDIIILYLFVDELKPGESIDTVTWRWSLGVYYIDEMRYRSEDGTEIKLENGVWKWSKPNMQQHQVYITAYMLLPEVDGIDWDFIP